MKERFKNNKVKKMSSQGEGGENSGQLSSKHVTSFSRLIVKHHGSELTFLRIFLYLTVPRNMDMCERVREKWRGRIIADVAATPPTPTFKTQSQEQGAGEAECYIYRSTRKEQKKEKESKRRKKTQDKQKRKAQ